VCVEEVELQGHIIDSLLLPKVLDEILEREGRFEILEMAVGERSADMSRVRLRVEATAPEALETILARLREQGIEPERPPYSVREGGSRLCFVRDPDGYRIEIIERA